MAEGRRFRERRQIPGPPGRPRRAAGKGRDRPDLIFLDIQMPEMSGFDFLSAVKDEPLPGIIFVTAFDEYALKAFEFHALDYLLKPFDRERFHASVQHAATAMRSKEEAHDYRYFPEPDLVPVVVDEAWIERSGASLPEFPEVRRDRYLTDFRLPRYDADILTAEKELADYFESVVAGLSKKSDETVKLASNWTMTEVLRVVNDRHIDLADLAVKPDHLAGMINLIVDGTISGKIAKEVFEEMLSSGERASVVVQRKGLVQISDTGAIEKTVDEVLAANPGEVEKFRAGKQQVFGFFVGEVMKRMKGKANPKVVNEILQKKLG